MSSDSTGEIHVVTKEDGSGVADVSEAANGGGAASPTASGSAPMPSWSISAAMRSMGGSWSYWVAGMALVGAMI
jgi:hypothetical protein